MGGLSHANTTLRNLEYFYENLPLRTVICLVDSFRKKGYCLDIAEGQFLLNPLHQTYTT